MTMPVAPSVDDEVIIVMPGIVAKARSSGAGDRRGHRIGAGAGQLRRRRQMVGKSTRGSAETGNWR